MSPLPKDMGELLSNIHSVLVEQLVKGLHTVGLSAEMSTGFDPWWDGVWGFGFLWPLFWVLVVIILLGAVVYFLSTETDDTTPDRALAVLRERYARGEIEKEEFEERASRLGNRPPDR